MHVDIRTEEPSDIAVIAEVTEQAFRHAAHTCGREHLLVADLRAAGALTVSLVAVANREIVGHVAASPVTVPESAGGWFGIGPLSVLPNFQRKGIGSRLMEAALTALRTRGARGCVLVGDPKFYSRFGFHSDPTLTVPGIPPEVCLNFRLQPNNDHGFANFHPAFLRALGG